MGSIIEIIDFSHGYFIRQKVLIREVIEIGVLAVSTTESVY